ncbi:MAG: hypothetical protein E7271_04135 [Lachnospiraceae bacterium]|jgi:hypothetical protein|nr:hypothetical protein [Lachnospiraceae bacterium]
MYNKIIHFNKYRRIRAYLLSGIMTFSMLFGMPSTVFATSDGGTSNETTEEVEEDVNSAAKVLKDTHGRIVLWKWEKVTQSNAGDLLNDDRFHPSMLVRMDTSGNYKGFISTYADKKHIYRGYDQTWYDSRFEKLVKASKESHGSKVSSEIGNDNCYNQYDSFFIKLDEQGTSLNNANVFGRDVFYTNGSNMGVPYIRAKKIGNNLRTKLKNRNTFRVDASMVLSRASAAEDPNDVSFYEVMDGTLGKDDFYIQKWWKGSGGEKNEPFITVTQPGDGIYSDKYEFCLQPYAAEAGGRGDTWVIKADLNEEDDSDLDGLDYAIAPSWQNDSSQDVNGFSTTLVTKGGYLLAMDVRRAGGNGSELSASSYGIGARAFTTGRNIYAPGFSNAECRFTWYVGTPYTFASLVGQGGDPETGEGGTTIIGKGELLEISNAEYMDVNNHIQRSDGLILPERAKIIINEGGVLSVTTNLINNGKIINNGGTIIVKDGGCISPFLDTSESKIDCRNGGNIVVMPKGRLFCLSDIYMGDADITNLSSQTEPSLMLSGGSSLINYGLFANSYCQIDKSSIIENRGEGVIMAACKRASNSKLLYDANIIVDGDYTVIDGIVPIDGKKLSATVGDNYIMMFGITCPQTYNGSFGSLGTYDMDSGGTIRCDKTATLARYAYSAEESQSNTDVDYSNVTVYHSLFDIPDRGWLYIYDKYDWNVELDGWVLKPQFWDNNTTITSNSVGKYYDAIRLVDVVEPDY